MPEYRSIPTIDIDLKDEKGRKTATLKIATTTSVNGVLDPLILVGAKEAAKWTEQPIQLLEGCTYDYALTGHPAGTRLRQGVFRASKLSDDFTERGTAIAAAHTGLLPLVLERQDGAPIAFAAVEVRSSKLGYREHYRIMLDYIAEQATDLLMELRSPAMVRLSPNFGRAPSTITQQFAFLRSILARREFQDALCRILALPHSTAARHEQDHDISRGLVPNSRTARQLAIRQPRIVLPNGRTLGGLQSVPIRIKSTSRAETTDTPENRFVKYALSEFADFLGAMEKAIVSNRRREDERLRVEVSRLRGGLENVLAHSMFACVSKPSFLPLGSPVLQNRAGYREVLRSWLSFNLAGNLSWEGGNDVYAAGKRDVATLYEYWLFFRLLELFGKKFLFSRSSLASLIEKTSDGFGLKLKTGQHMPLFGNFEGYGRQLNVRFSYNRTFVRHGSSSMEANYPAPGSWTQRMRPDYTLSIWPADLNEEDAEINELMIHLHFDAKYRVDKVAEFFGEDTEEALNEARIDHVAGRSAKRDDLLKMHAYRDAIRRSTGAYVLYPGTETRCWREFHELLPNLGAFAIRPDDTNDGTLALSLFIDDVLRHLCDRTSLREKQNNQIFAIQSSIKEPVSHDISMDFSDDQLCQ